MKLKEDIDYTAFLLKVRECGGEVHFCTLGGDRLNLRSLLSEYVFITAAMGSNLAQDGQVSCEYTTDYKLLADFLEGVT